MPLNELPTFVTGPENPLDDRPDRLSELLAGADLTIEVMRFEGESYAFSPNTQDALDALLGAIQKVGSTGYWTADNREVLEALPPEYGKIRNIGYWTRGHWPGKE